MVFSAIIRGEIRGYKISFWFVEIIVTVRPRLQKYFRKNDCVQYMVIYVTLFFSACASSPCTRGTCVSIRRVPYYRCEGDCVGEECDEITLTEADGDTDQCTDDESCSEDLVCLNGGTLRTTANMEFCDCPPGFTGDSCELVELCTDDGYCRNGGSCKTISKAEFRCVCSEGYFGERCQFSTTCSGDHFRFDHH